MTFKTQLISSITLASTVVLAVFIGIAYVSLNISESRFSEEAIRGKSVLWQKVITVQLDSMTNSMTSLTRARDTLKALRKADNQALAESMEATYNRLTSSEIVSRLQVTDLSGNIIFSKPNSFSGPTSKSLVHKAIKEKKVFQGIELDDDGQLVSEVAFPLYYRGKLAGVGIYMTELSKALENFKLADGSDVHLFDKGVLKGSTNAEQFGLIQLPDEKAETSMQYKQAIGEQIFSLVQLPLQDASGNAVANLLTSTDYTDSYTRQSSIYSSGLISLLVAIMLSMVFIYWFIGRAFKPMYKCLDIMSHISSGNLTDKIEISCTNEFGLLMKGLKDMQSKLKGMIDDINKATFQIESSAHNLEKVTHEASDRVENQQQLTQQLVTSIDSLLQASEEVTNSTNDSIQATVQADDEIGNGKNIIIQSVETIKQISERVNSAESVVQDVHRDSENIGSVLDVIKGIAEQTNLLALNAAIEAARAGEQGRGFAVVADEVRTLASRTAESTNEIEAMIENLQKAASNAVDKMGGSIDMVNKGVDMAAQADDSFGLISQTVSSINEKCSFITDAATNQMGLSKSMHDHVKGISDESEKAVHGNKTTVESSQELIELSNLLKNKVSQFQT